MADKVLAKSKSFYSRYDRNPGANKEATHYCPGCGHGVLHKLIAEALDDFGIRERTILASPVGCSVFAYYYFRVGNIQCPHGRAPAVATGVKRSHPHSIVISYQGDGDMAAIGGNEIIQAANRGENITVFFVNNAIYGMTGGQMAPTTLIGQRTTTSPRGRTSANEGYPIRMSEMIATLEAPVYVERVALTDPKNTNKVRRAVRKALQIQMDNKGFSLVEVLSVCPSGWKMTPTQSKQWLTDSLMKQYPLAIFKDNSEAMVAQPPHHFEFSTDGLRSKLDIPAKEFIGRPEQPLQQRYDNPRLILAGFGGQGVLMLGLVLAQSGMEAGYHVSWIPSYGPEMRGGTANCHVNLSSRRIGSPTVSRPTVLVAMNGPSLEKFEPSLVHEGLVIYDSSLISQAPARRDIEVLAVPATRIADELGNARIANMVILGAYLAHTRCLSKEVVLAALPTVVKRKNLIPLNQQAIEKGIEFVEQKAQAR